jgi:hypothetical protein
MATFVGFFFTAPLALALKRTSGCITSVLTRVPGPLALAQATTYGLDSGKPRPRSPGYGKPTANALSALCFVARGQLVARALDTPPCISGYSLTGLVTDQLRNSVQCHERQMQPHEQPKADAVTRGRQNKIRRTPPVHLLNRRPTHPPSDFFFLGFFFSTFLGVSRQG